MTVSVAMCTYNGAKYIREQIDSILGQTVQDIELVVCDDCSSDETPSILHEYAHKDQRIRIYQNEQNLGFKQNFAKAVSLCTGEYIALSDQDDIWTPDHIEVLWDILGDKSLAIGNSMLVDEHARSLGLTLKEQEGLHRIPDCQDELLYMDVLFRNPFQGACMLFHKSFVRSVLPIPDGVGFHDTWFACCAMVMDGISYTEQVLSHYRMHNNNVSGLHMVRQTKRFAKRVIKSQFYADRKPLVSALIERNIAKSNEMQKALQRLDRVLNNSTTRLRKLRNIPFLLMHFSRILSI